MEIGIITKKQLQQDAYLLLFWAAARKHKVNLRVFYPGDFVIRVKGNEVNLLGKNREPVHADGFINWAPYAQMDQLSLACSILQIPFVNEAEAVYTLRNSMLTSLKLCRAGIEQPESFYFCDQSRRLFTSGQTPAMFLQQLKTNRKQYFERLAPGRDWHIRVIATAERVLGAVSKSVIPGAGRTRPMPDLPFEACSIDGQLAGLVLKAVKALNLQLAGLDLLHDGQGNYTVIGVDAAPTLAIFEKTTGTAIAEKIISFMIELIRTGRQSIL